jgi:hypothetical protein
MDEPAQPLAIGAAAVGLPGAAHAQAFPTHPVRIITPFPAELNFALGTLATATVAAPRSAP